MKKLTLAVAALATLLAPVFAGGGGDKAAAPAAAPAKKAEPIELQLGTAFDRATPMALASQKFADEVKAATNGQVIINVFTNSALGTEKDEFTAVAADELDFTVGGVLTIDMYAPEYGFISAPYLYASNDHLAKVMASPLADGMYKKFKDNNTAFLGILWRGARNTSSDREIHAPADVKGLKIRMTEMPSWVGVWKDGLGAITVPIPLGELYQALQQGVVEASEGPYDQLATNKFYEVQKYLINTKHVYDWSALYASEKMLQRLPPEYRKIIEQKGKEIIGDYGSKLAADKASEYHKQLIDGGMKEINVDTAPFQKAVLSVYDKFFKPSWTAATYEQVQSYHNYGIIGCKGSDF
jgi:tripartite ATP-independent transporter DctP family solute receptor